MTENKFILVNLEDTKSKELAQIISSDTARKILNLLSEKSYSESDISKKLNIPLPTTHYNIQHLLKAEVIEEKDFLWSEKGKKIRLYQVSNKLIIIAPKNTNVNFMEKLREIIPVALIGLLTTAGIYAYQLTNNLGVINLQKTELLTDSSLETKIVSEAAPMATSFNDISHSTIQNTTITPDVIVKEPNYALWFLLGILTIILVYVIIQYIRTRRKK